MAHMGNYQLNSQQFLDKVKELRNISKLEEDLDSGFIYLHVSGSVHGLTYVSPKIYDMASDEMVSFPQQVNLLYWRLGNDREARTYLSRIPREDHGAGR